MIEAAMDNDRADPCIQARPGRVVFFNIPEYFQKAGIEDHLCVRLVVGVADTYIHHRRVEAFIELLLCLSVVLFTTFNDGLYMFVLYLQQQWYSASKLIRF